LDANGNTEQVPALDLSVGDHIRLLPGETLPVDGRLVDGLSSFDESLLTGEAEPVLHRPGDSLVAGAVNVDQSIVVEVLRPLQASALSEIQRLVRQGLEQRPRYALLAERVARWFVAVLLLIATTTAGFWLWYDPQHWLANTIAVLIVTCPCALALATPVSLAVSAGRFVRLGVLPLRMEALDALALTDTLAFDKTGTLTRGRPELATVEVIGGRERQALLDIAATIATVSEHPLARALRGAGDSDGLQVEASDNRPGAGIRATIAGHDWALGSPAFITDLGYNTSDQQRGSIDDLRHQGHTVSLLADDQGPQAILSFTDPLRPGITAMIAELRRNGIDHVAILSGDSQAAVDRIGRQLGIADCHGGLSPADKMAWIQARQASGHPVGMFGDGINDAPVLAAADVSLSFSDATDLANASSDFLLLGNDANALPAVPPSHSAAGAISTARLSS
jgi:Cu2+-exporting ATPase